MKTRRAANERKKLYSIGVVAKMYNVHPQTLRLYEREGLLRPSRTAKNTRLYSEEDLKRLETILNLTREMGVNLAGVEIIMNLLDKIEEMKAQINQLLRYLQEELSQEIQDFDARMRTALVRAPRMSMIPLDEWVRTEGEAEPSQSP